MSGYPKKYIQNDNRQQNQKINIKSQIISHTGRNTIMSGFARPIQPNLKLPETIG